MMARMGTILSAAAALLFAALLYPATVPSVVYVRADPDGVGTGWVVDAAKKQILTCRHVVGERTTLEVFFPAFRDASLLADSADYMGKRAERRNDGTLVTGKVLRTSEALDLALIEVPTLPAGTRALPIAGRSPALGTTALSIGHRGDLDALWNATVGTLRQRGKLADGYFWQSQRLAANLTALVLQSPIEEGDSGGPVVNGRGEVVGMISALRRRVPLAAVGPDATAIRAFLKLDEPTAKESRSAVETVARCTVWIRPTATDARTAGVLIDRERRWVLTSAAGVGPLDRVGMTFPLLTSRGEIAAERDGYRDGTELLLAKRWAIGTVLHRDPRRDLALVQLDAIPDGVNAVSLADAEPRVTDRAFAVSHPMGLEFAFVAASGTLRQRGRVALGRDPDKPLVNLFQLPAQAAAAGGPICNERGELLGISAAKEAPLQQAYSASLGDVRAFVSEVPARSLLSNARKLASELDSREKFAAWVWLVEAARLSLAGKPAEAKQALDSALRLHPACSEALLMRARENAVAGSWPRVIADCDALLAGQPQHREALLARAHANLQTKEVKRAIGDLQRRLDTDPGDLEFRTALAKAYGAGGEPAKAAEELARIARLKGVMK